VQGRGGIGIIAMDTSERNGEVVNLCLVTSADQFMCITNGGQVIRTEVNQVREVGRNTQGVRVMSLGDNERVVDVAKLAERDDEARAPRTPDGGSEPEGGAGPEGGSEPELEAEPEPELEAEPEPEPEGGGEENV
jgi:DNA gyrase subunit A